MQLENHTKYPAGLARMVYDEDRVAASVLVRVTYEIRGEQLYPGEGQPWIVSNEPWMGPKGMMDSDFLFYRGGVDVFLFAHAVAERGKPTTKMDVKLQIGAEFRRRVSVFGPRVWHRRGAGLVPTPPRPFTRLPLTLQYAYGGREVWDDLEIPFLENPGGMGFYVNEGSAVDRPLPCIEEPDQLIVQWDNRPPPAGLVPYPPMSPLRAKNGIVVTPEGRPKITPGFYNMAFPPMIAGRISAGDTVLVSGVSERGPVGFALPRHAFFVRLRFGTEEHDVGLNIDQVGIDLDGQNVFVAYRFPFRYVIHELQERTCELFERSFDA